jgi:plastocyanin
VKTRFAVLLALLALVPFGVAACGDDDDDEATDEPTTTEETTDTGTGSDGGGGGSTVSFTANPDGELAFEEDSASATAGSVTIELTNEASVPHDVRIESPEGEDVGGTEEVTGDTTTAEVELETGDYTFYCSVPGHREAGMEGTLTVE